MKSPGALLSCRAELRGARKTVFAAKSPALAGPPSQTPRKRTSTTTEPTSVNLTALFTRFATTCRRRVGSPSRKRGTRSSRRHTSSRDSCCARTTSSTSRTHVAGFIGTSSRLMPPASILEKSRMSLMTTSSILPEVRMRFTYSSCSALSPLFNSSSVLASIPFMGVRICAGAAGE